MRPPVLFALAIISVILSATSVFAHGSGYFAFDPDTSSPLLPPSGAAVYEVFRPHNDFLRGLDIWVDNVTGTADVSFGLRDENNDLLAAKTVTVPVLAAKWGGNKVHVDFDSSVPVAYDREYKIKILTDDTNLRIYKANRISVVLHNADDISEPLIGFARLNAVDQNYSLKYALYETTEASLPAIVSASGTAVSETQAKISFSATEPVDAQVEYGPADGAYTNTAGFSGVYKICVPLAPACSVIIGVVAGTNYNFRLTVKDEWGNTAEFVSSFGTPGAPPPPSDTQAPSIPTSLSATAISSSQINLSWTASTDNIGVTGYHIYRGGTLIAAVTTGTTYSDTGLNPATLYSYSVVAYDAAGNVSGYSSIVSGTTQATLPPPGPPAPPPGGETPPDIIPPTILNARLVSATANSATFVWTTNEAADSLALVKRGLDIFGVASDPTFELEHLLTVTGLMPNTDYFVTLVSRDPSANVASQNLTFGTRATDESSEQASSSNPDTQTVGGIIIGGTEPAGGDGGSLGGFNVAWKSKSGAEPEGGYRVDIFDDNWVLVGQRTLPSGTHATRFDDLFAGNYRVVVYELKNGTAEKVSSPAPVTIKVSWLQGASAYSAYFAFALVLLSTMFISLFLIEKKRRVGLAATKVSQ